MKILSVFFVVLFLLFSLSTFALAQPVDKNWYDYNRYINDDTYKTGITKVKQLEVTAGIGYSLMDNHFIPIYTKRMAEYKRWTIELGYNADDLLLGGMSYHWFTLQDVFKRVEKIPILNWVEFNTGILGGWKRLQAFNGTTGNNEWDILPAITLIKKEF